MKFKTKIDWWINLVFAAFLIVNIFFAVSFVYSFADIGDIIGIISLTPVSIFLILPIWLNTYYFLDKDELLVKSGLMKGKRISYSQIISISETRSFISSPALSLDRLEIKYKAKSGNFSDTIIISPKEKAEFIKELRARNENIESSDGKAMSKSSKIAIIITVASLAAVGVMFITGIREPIVTVHSDNIQISAMYGLNVDFSDISDISLLEQSMREIGAGIRINGFNGGTWRGHFTAGLLFVVPDSSPTIRIERNRGDTIFINFRDYERTRSLYDELSYYVQ